MSNIYHDLVVRQMTVGNRYIVAGQYKNFHSIGNMILWTQRQEWLDVDTVKSRRQFRGLYLFCPSLLSYILLLVGCISEDQNQKS